LIPKDRRLYYKIMKKYEKDQKKLTPPELLLMGVKRSFKLLKKRKQTQYGLFIINHVYNLVDEYYSNKGIDSYILEEHQKQEMYNILEMEFPIKLKK